MALVSWFTIIGFFITIFGFLIQEELKVFLWKLKLCEKIISITILIIFIPFLIFFNAILLRFEFLKIFTCSDGFQPENIAFVLFYVTFLWLLFRIKFFVPTKKLNKDIANIYLNLLDDKQIDKFWRLFKKYEKKNYKSSYQQILFHKNCMDSFLERDINSYDLKCYNHVQEYSENKINYYIELLENSQVNKCYQLLKIFESKANINTNWDKYETVILNPLFLKMVVEKDSDFLLQFWNNFNNENNFSKVFRAYLKNPQSAYYRELKENLDSDEIVDGHDLLKCLLEDNLKQSIDNDLINHISVYFIDKLIEEYKYGQSSIYNQLYNENSRTSHIIDLPFACHIQFINILYYSSIRRKVDISTISHRYTNMQTIYSSWLKQIIENLNCPLEWRGKAIYYKLIDKIFSNTNRWISLFNEDDYFDSKSSYLIFINACCGHCLDELYKGFEINKISEDYIKKIIHYDLLNFYFGYQTKNELRDTIEKYCISRIPKKIISIVFKNSLDECLALNYNNFLRKDFSFPATLRDRDKEVLNRLHDFLLKNNLIDIID